MIPREQVLRKVVEQRPALTAAQWAIYEAGWDPTARFRVAVCGRRFGKALALDTLLPSPDGWTSMGEVTTGMRLFDERGRICVVIFVTEVMFGRPCNELLFDDGSVITADDDHVWSIIDCDTKIGGLLTTRQISHATAHGRKLQIQSCSALTLHRRNDISMIVRRRTLLRRVSNRYGRRHQDGTWYVFGSARLIERIETLCLSLGLVPRRVTGKMQAGVAWRVSRKDRFRQILSVQSIPSRPVRCIQVDSKSSLFLCSRTMIPTHNTFLMAEELRRAARLAVQANIGIENEIWYGAPNAIQAKRVMWSRLKKAIPGSWLAGRPLETNCSLRLRSGHVIRLVGLDASDSLRGSGLWFFGGDEWADCRPSAWREVIRPMLSTTQGHALFIGTPKGFDHFRDAYLLGQPNGDPSYRSFMFTTEEGGNVPQEELDAARRELDPRVFRQEYGASFETYAGRVIYAFSRADNVRQWAYNPLKPVYVGMDFNVNPMSATIWQEDGETTRQVDEIILPTSNTDEMADEITCRFGRNSFEPGRKTVDHIEIYPDPAGSQRRTSAGGRTDIGILRERGFIVVVPRAHPPVRDRMNVMNWHFRAADGNISAMVGPQCRHSIEAYERLVYREGSNEPDKTQGFDHLVDASGYYLFGRRRTISSTQNTSSFMER